MPTPSARFSFTINAKQDIDAQLIDFLNGFSPTERRMFIIDALREAYVRTVTGEEWKEADVMEERFEKLEQTIKAVLDKIDKISRNGVVVQTKTQPKSNTDLSQAEVGLENIWSNNG